uniref:Secreted protein n=1 Tax=Caenorhabditis tropicalis TaxID=1561998 RepID=A0A1I7T592_9PELO
MFLILQKEKLLIFLCTSIGFLPPSTGRDSASFDNSYRKRNDLSKSHWLSKRSFTCPIPPSFPSSSLLPAYKQSICLSDTSTWTGDIKSVEAPVELTKSRGSC